ncbi:hypothetical protein Q31b_10990 [Novipirellula aureliae]|uniref:GxxExxY protein n=1 Tax=Novipirellula aureliae TaxID=2527966 RepID=A0A5C6E8C6_9BACT|nr:GxxExxY protein [Novipirellula aureliae]TWU45923.1 hypothetical protein Q31b_10990 [Novipirellula aureliae]
MTELIFKDECYKIVGASMEVYNEMGCGFLEAVYQECLEYEFGDRKIPFVCQQQLQLQFKKRILKAVYIPDFICYDQIIVEIKGTSDLADKFRAQMINYLKATGLKLGLLVNFGKHGAIQYERIVY